MKARAFSGAHHLIAGMREQVDACVFERIKRQLRRRDRSCGFGCARLSRHL